MPRDIRSLDILCVMMGNERFDRRLDEIGLLLRNTKKKKKLVLDERKLPFLQFVMALKAPMRSFIRLGRFFVQMDTVSAETLKKARGPAGLQNAFRTRVGLKLMLYHPVEKMAGYGHPKDGAS